VVDPAAIVVLAGTVNWVVSLEDSATVATAAGAILTVAVQLTDVPATISRIPAGSIQALAVDVDDSVEHSGTCGADNVRVSFGTFFIPRIAEAVCGGAPVDV